MDYTQTEVLQFVVENSPIAICDGMSIGSTYFFENSLLSWLKFNGIGGRITVEDKLYERENFDLSPYKTIAFNTQGEEKLKDSFEKIIRSFSKDNLKVVIIGNDKSYFKVKNLAEKLGIQLIGFDYHIATKQYLEMGKAVGGSVSVTLDDVWEMDDLPGLFYDPKEKFC